MPNTLKSQGTRLYPRRIRLLPHLGHRTLSIFPLDAADHSTTRKILGPAPPFLIVNGGIRVDNIAVIQPHLQEFNSSCNTLSRHLTRQFRSIASQVIEGIAVAINRSLVVALKCRSLGQLNPMRHPARSDELAHCVGRYV